MSDFLCHKLLCGVVVDVECMNYAKKATGISIRVVTASEFSSSFTFTDFLDLIIIRVI